MKTLKDLELYKCINIIFNKCYATGNLDEIEQLGILFASTLKQALAEIMPEDLGMIPRLRLEKRIKTFFEEEKNDYFFIHR